MRGARDNWGGRRQWLQGLAYVTILVVGVIAGLLLGARACTPAVPPTVREENYLVLLATLYSQGESLDAIRGRLAGIGYENPTEALLELADRYTASKDRKQQRQAEDLRQLAEAMLGGDIVPTLAAQPTVPAARSPTVVAAAQTTATASPSSQAEPQTQPQPEGTGTPEPASSPSPPPSRGIVQTSDGTPARLRTQPTTQGSETIEGLTPGTEVQVLEVVDGEAIDPSEKRWFRVKHGEFIGFVYYKLIRTVE